MNTTRIDNDEALRLIGLHKLTANHVLVTDSKRIRATEHGDKSFRFWYGDGMDDYVSEDVLTILLCLTDAHVELETPSPFDDEAFAEWSSSLSGAQEEYKFFRTATISPTGLVTVDSFKVPVSKIPEAARLINQLLALGETK